MYRTAIIRNRRDLSKITNFYGYHVLVRYYGSGRISNLHGVLSPKLRCKHGYYSTYPTWFVLVVYHFYIYYFFIFLSLIDSRVESCLVIFRSYLV